MPGEYFLKKVVHEYMKDVLSRLEADSLISSLGPGEMESEGVNPKAEGLEDINTYDFKRPNKFSKEQIRTLQIIHENFARTLGNFLSAYVRTVIKIEVTSISQVSYGEFINSLPVPTFMAVLRLSPQLGSAVLQTDLKFVFPVIDLLCGGEGQVSTNLRELTEIEQTMMKRVYTTILDNLKYSWQDITSLESVIDSLETNPQYNQALASNETVVIITLQSQVGDNQGFINICLPFISLEPVINQLSAQHCFRNMGHKPKKENMALLCQRIEGSEVELTVNLGETVISMKDFLEIQVGDVLPLEKSLGQELDLYVENSLKYKVLPGISGNKRSVQITRWVGEEVLIDG